MTKKTVYAVYQQGSTILKITDYIKSIHSSREEANKACREFQYVSKINISVKPSKFTEPPTSLTSLTSSFSSFSLSSSSSSSSSS